MADGQNEKLIRIIAGLVIEYGPDIVATIREVISEIGQRDALTETQREELLSILMVDPRRIGLKE